MDSDSSGPYPAEYFSGCFPRLIVHAAHRGGNNII